MTELSGTLEGVGLPAIVRFLYGLKKTGRLHVSQGDWQGEIYFTAGQVTGATFGSRNGLPALDGLVEALPTGNFLFEVASVAGREVDITLSPDELQVHMDAVVVGLASGAAGLPSFEAVPEVIVRDAPGAGHEPLPLDRMMLLTLLAVDGHRTVREIVAHRGTIDALWQLGTLAEVGLIRVASSNPGPANAFDPNAIRPIVLEVQPQDGASHCPKLGFEDDPRNSFGRPTRLHRCFAAGAPLPLSIDQQRELCLSDQFGTCPRLSMAAPRTFGRPPRPSEAGSAPVGDDSRIVHLPVGGRNGASQRHVVGATELTQFRGPLRDGEAPTPLRGRAERMHGAASAPGPVAEPPSAPRPEPRAPAQQSVVAEPGGARLGGIPVTVIAGIAVVFSVLAVMVYLLLPYLGDLFADDNIDSSALPNTSAVAAGAPAPITPVAPALRATAAARATAVAASTPGASASAASAASGAAAPAVPTLEPEASLPVPNGAAPATAPSASALPPPGTLVDEHFTSNALNWPSNPQGTAWLTSGGYRLIPRQAGQFVAIGAPLAEAPRDVVVSVTFRKLDGPPGGGYGIILRDQGRVSGDPTTQQGHFYVLEAGDKGEVGIWRRDADHWVDLLPWQHTDAIHTGSGTNELVARAVGDSLTLSVNGTQVATRADGALSSGGIGLFVGGDGNQVVVEHFAVQTP